MAGITVYLEQCPFHTFDMDDITSADTLLQARAFSVWKELLSAKDFKILKGIQNTELAQSLWRMGWYISTLIPTPEKPEVSAVASLAQLALEAYRDNQAFGDDFAQRKATNAVVRNLHWVFCCRTTTKQVSRRYSPSTWDCVAKSLHEWITDLAVVQEQCASRPILVSPIKPQWTMLSESDAGLLFAGAFFSRVLLVQFQIPQLATEVQTSVHPVGDNTFATEAPRDRYILLRRVIGLETVRRIEKADFINTSVSLICWRYARFFGEHLKHPSGGLFIDVELCNAMTSFEANLKEYESAYAFRCFAKHLARTLPMAYLFSACDHDNPENQWDCLREGFAAWSALNVRHVEITLQPQLIAEPTPKAMYLLMRQIFERSDLGVWNVPLQGWDRPAHQWEDVAI